MPSIADVFVTVAPETAKVADGIRDALRRADPAVAEAGRRWGTELQRSIGKIEVEVDADTAKAEAQIDIVGRDRHTTVHMDVDRDELSRMGTTVASSVAASAAQGASTLSSAVTQQASTMSSGISQALGPISAVVVPAALITGLVDLAGVAAAASGAIGLIPAAIGGVVAAVGTLKIATDGFGDALKNIRDPEKFAAALQTLTPNAQQAALSIQALLPAFDQLKAAAQNALFAGVGQQLNALANQYLPTIQNMTTGIAAAFNQMFTGITTQLMTPETQAAIQTITTNITQAFQNLAPAMAPLTKAFADIMAVGSGFLPQLAQSAASAAQSFSNFITQASQSGQLQQWIQQAINVFRQLGPLVLDVGRAFLELAPAGERILPTIVNLVHDLAAIMPVIAAAAEVPLLNFEAWRDSLTKVQTAFHAIEGVAQAVGSVVMAVMNNIRGAIDAALAPIRAAIDLANHVPGVNIPNIPSLAPTAPAAPALPVPGPGQPTQGGVAGAQRDRRGAAPIASPPPARIVAPVPAGGYTVPVPTPPTTPSAPSVPSVPAAPSIPAVAPSAYTPTTASGYTTDAALLANVPAGRYTQTQGADLTKGLADCSSAVEDLVNIMDGRSTAGRSMSTGNEAQWLTQHGFVQGMGGPGDFRVGFNGGHTQATLPGGTPFNWGSNAAAANRGIGGTGADDPAFTQHYYRPVGNMPAGVTGTPGPTGSQNDPYYTQYPAGYKPPGPDMGQFGQQMGSDIWSEILPEGFKNPTQFGSMKFLTGLLNGLTGIKLPVGGDGASQFAPGGGGGGGGFGGLLSGLTGFIPQPVGALKSGSPGSAPGSYIPGMPAPSDAQISPFGVTGNLTAGPGNQPQTVNAPINIVNPIGQDHLTNMVNTANQAQVPRVRQGVRPLPG